MEQIPLSPQSTVRPPVPRSPQEDEGICIPSFLRVRPCIRDIDLFPLHFAPFSKITSLRPVLPCLAENGFLFPSFFFLLLSAVRAQKNWFFLAFPALFHCFSCSIIFCAFPVSFMVLFGKEEHLPPFTFAISFSYFLPCFRFPYFALNAFLFFFPPFMVFFFVRGPTSLLVLIP